MKKQPKIEDLGIVLGSDEMKFWHDLIEARKIDLQLTEQNLKFYKWMLEKAQIEYDRAKQEFERNA